MVDRINPIIPRNPDIFPVQPVGQPKIDPQERERRRREREEERAEEERRERERPRRAPEQRPRPPRPDGGGSIDVTA